MKLGEFNELDKMSFTKRTLGIFGIVVAGLSLYSGGCHSSISITDADNPVAKSEKLFDKTNKTTLDQETDNTKILAEQQKESLLSSDCSKTLNNTDDTIENVSHIGEISHNILVFGGAGYIGSHTVRLLSDKGYNCVVADNLIYGHRESIDSFAKFEYADLMDKESIDSLFQKYNIDAVVHFAAFAYVGESVVDPQKYYQNNVIGTLNLLQSMLQHNVKKIVFSSTCATYGEPQYTPIDEEHPQNPINPYGRTKLMIENIFSDYERAYGLKHISLRYFNAAGASSDGLIGESHNPETHLIPLVLNAIKRDIPSIKVFGTDYDTPDGTCIRDYIHVDDLANAHYLALNKLNEYCGCINLGTGNGISVKEIISTAEKVTGRKCPTEYVGRRAGDPAKLFAANEKAKTILNWTPICSDIENIIATVWNWELNKRF